MSAAPHHATVRLDGADQLHTTLARAGYSSIAAAVSEHTVFLHPHTVAQTRGYALFPIIRGQPRGFIDRERGVLLDDNLSPTNAFLWASSLPKGRDLQFNHIWSCSKDPKSYSALWNICVTPAFLAKTTDGSNHPEITAMLRYRALELFGHHPAGEPRPARPADYENFRWAPHPAPIEDLESAIRRRLRRAPRSRTTTACRELGWLFSDWAPDPNV